MILADLYDARGLLIVPDGHPLAWLRFNRTCSVGQLGMTNPRGSGICAWCESGAATSKGCRYHAGCDDEVAIRTGGGVARWLVKRRDESICALCGRDASKLTWEVHHVVPVVEGGGCCGIANLQTLCLACHRRPTAELAGRRALAERRRSFEEKGGIVVPAQMSLDLFGEPW